MPDEEKKNPNDFVKQSARAAIYDIVRSKKITYSKEKVSLPEKKGERREERYFREHLKSAYENNAFDKHDFSAQERSLYDDFVHEFSKRAGRSGKTRRDDADRYGEKLIHKKSVENDRHRKASEKAERLHASEDRRIERNLQKRDDELGIRAEDYRKGIFQPIDTEKLVKERNRAKKTLADRAKKDSQNVNLTIHAASRAKAEVRQYLKGDIQEKELAEELLEDADRNTRMLRHSIYRRAMRPAAVSKLNRIHKLERDNQKRSRRLARADRKEVQTGKRAAMASFMSDVHENEAAALYGLTGDREIRKNILKDASGRVRLMDIEQNSLTQNAVRNREYILKQMQKRKYKKQYAKAVRDGASGAVVHMRENLMSYRVSLLQKSAEYLGRVKGILAKSLKQMKTKLLAGLLGCLVSLFGGVGIAFGGLAMLFFVFTQFFDSTVYLSSWGNITEITNYFTKKETDFFTEVKNYDYSGYEEVSFYFNGEKLEETETVSAKDAFLKKLWENGQCSQIKYVSYIAAASGSDDFNLATSVGLLDSLYEDVYNAEFDEDDIWGWNSSGEWAPTDDEELIVSVNIRDIDEVIEEKLGRLEEAGGRYQGVMSRYQMFQYTRGNQTTLANPLSFNWLSASLSDQSGYRIIERDGELTEEYHAGIDIAGNAHFPIFTSTKSTIKDCGFEESMGNYVIVMTEDETIICYMHLEDVFVSKGDILKRHRRIGTMGNTGDSTGNHLHVEVQIKNEDGEYQYINPLFIFSSIIDESLY